VLEELHVRERIAGDGDQVGLHAHDYSADPVVEAEQVGGRGRGGSDGRRRLHPPLDQHRELPCPEAMRKRPGVGSESDLDAELERAGDQRPI
jgi:hypothetical protein